MPASGLKTKLVLAVAAPAVFLGLLELGLALAGVNVARYDGLGDHGRYWVPWPSDGDEAASDGAAAEPGFQRVFPRRYRQFPERLPVFLRDKPADGWRLFALGESSVKGFPYEVGCFSDWLRLRATAMLPGRSVEVVNAGNVGWHATDIRRLLQECLEHEPDALVWMVGNNEFVPHNVLGLREELLHPARHTLHRAVYGLRTSRWLADVLPRFQRRRLDLFDRQFSEERPFFGPELPLLKQRFADVTAGAVEDAHAAGVPIILCTMPRNLRDWAPTSSYYSEALWADPALRARWDEAYLVGLSALEPAEGGDVEPARALEHLARAAEIDATPAKLHFAQARAYEALGADDLARAAYARSLAQEGGPSRAQDWVEDTIREVARDHGAPLVDLEAHFAAAGRLGLAGRELLSDGMHPNLAGHELIADLLVDALERDLQVPFDRTRDIGHADGIEQLGIGDQQVRLSRSAEALNLVRLALQAGVVNETWRRARDSCRLCLGEDQADFEVMGGLGLLEAIAGNAETARLHIERAMTNNVYVKISYVFYWKTELPYQKAFAAAGLDMAAVEAALTDKQRLMLDNHLFRAGTR